MILALLESIRNQNFIDVCFWYYYHKTGSSVDVNILLAVLIMPYPAIAAVFDAQGYIGNSVSDWASVGFTNRIKGA
jgi:hypothetical protein